jgi:CBS domain-containing protein
MLSAVTFRPPSAPHRMAFVADVMREGIYTCQPSATLREVARTMADRRIHCVVVTGLADREAWGVVSDLDVVRAAGADLNDVTAGEAASGEAVTVAASATLGEAAQLMAEHEAAHLLVVLPATGRPIGVISTLDLARALASNAG